MKRVLITDDCDRLLQEGLEKLGFSCDFQPGITDTETRKIIGSYTGLVINSKIKVDREMMSSAPLLRFVARLGSGMEVVDQEAAREYGISAIFSPEGNRNAVAEHAMGMLLALSNNLIRADREVRQRIWKREANRGWELEGRTVGIIGFGHTGKRFAQKLAGFGVRVLAYDKYLAPGYATGLGWVEECDLADLVRQSEIISLHLPLTDETRHYVDNEFLKQCLPGVVLVNTSRGACIKTVDLAAGLESGKVRGACLDVFENEKTETFTPEESVLYERIYRMDQVVLSPHVAGWTQESKRNLAAVLLEKISCEIKDMKN